MEQDQSACNWCRSSPTSSISDQTSLFGTNQNSQPGREVHAEQADIFGIEEMAPGDIGRGSNAQVVKPYAIEEPDDESTYEFSNRLLSLPQNIRAEPGQGDLVDSMEGLHCDSDHSDPRLQISPKRGRKRKPPTNGPSGISRPFQRRPSKSLFDAQYEGSRLSPKRQRRISKRSRENTRTTTTPTTTTQDPLRARGWSGSSGTSLSTDASGANPTSNGSTTPEGMDID